MSQINLTLNEFRIPGFENFIPDFGTKEATGVSVSSENVVKNAMMPFTKMRPFVVVEDVTTTVVETDCTIEARGQCAEIELNSAAYNGCKVSVINSTEHLLTITHNNEIVGQIKAGSHSQYYYNGTTWIINSLNVAGGDGSIAEFARYAVFDFSASNRKTLKIKRYTNIPLDIVSIGGTKRRVVFSTGDYDQHYDLTEMITAAANATSTRTGEINGRNFYVYIYEDDDASIRLIVSCNSTFPNDVDPRLTANNTRKIAQFHTLCADVGTTCTAIVPASPGITGVEEYCVKGYNEDEDGFSAFYTRNVSNNKAQTYYNVLTVDHPLKDFVAGDILPESIWCLTFKPHCCPDGMVYDINTDTAVDIYLQSGTGKNTASVFNGTTTRTRQAWNHQDDMLQTNKLLPSDTEFLSFAAGSNERTSIYGAAESSIQTTGAHIDTANRRMISFIGCEDCCGGIWQWLRDIFGVTNNTTPTTQDGHGSFGQCFWTIQGLLAGGCWPDGVANGSRTRGAFAARDYASDYFGGRGVSRVMRVV